MRVQCENKLNITCTPDKAHVYKQPTIIGPNSFYLYYLVKLIELSSLAEIQSHCGFHKHSYLVLNLS